MADVYGNGLGQCIEVQRCKGMGFLHPPDSFREIHRKLGTLLAVELTFSAADKTNNKSNQNKMITTMKTRILIILSIFLASSIFALAAWPPPPVSNEVWISPVGTDGTGTGTAADPYISTSEQTFAQLLGDFWGVCSDETTGVKTTIPSVIPANSMIHLMAGTFHTFGDIVPLNNWKIRGAGIDVTIIQCSPWNLDPMTGSKYAMAFANGNTNSDANTDGVEISDMTIDCNFQANTSTACWCAIWLGGGNNTRVSRVKGINWGTTDSSEDRVFVIGGNSMRSITNCVIEDCIVGPPAQVTTFSNGVDGFTIWGSPANVLDVNSIGWIHGAEVRNCRMDGIGSDTNGNGAPTYLIGISLGNLVGAKVDGNIFININGSAVYASCYSLIDCSIENNMFLDVGCAVNFQEWDSCGPTDFLKENIRITDNFITVNTGGTAMSLYGYDGIAITNLTIENNIAQASIGAGPVTGLSVGNAYNLAVMNNIIDANGGSSIEIGTNVTVSQMDNNQDLAGASVNLSNFITNYEADQFVMNNSIYFSIKSQSQISLNANGAYFGEIGNPSQQDWSLGVGLSPTGAYTSILSWTPYNGVTISPQPGTMGNFFQVLDTNSSVVFGVNPSGIVFGNNGTAQFVVNNSLYLSPKFQSQISLNANGAYYGEIGNPSPQDWSLGVGLSPTGAYTSILSWTPYNGVTISPQPGTMTNFFQVLNTNGSVAFGVNSNGIAYGNGSGLTSLNASQLTSGTMPLAQLPSSIITNYATGLTLNGTFGGNGSGLTGITASQVGADILGAAQQATNGFGNIVTHNTGEFAQSINTTIWSSLSVTNVTATNWATLSVTPSNAVISVQGVNVAILQTNGVLSAINGLSTTISNNLSPASSSLYWNRSTNGSQYLYIALLTNNTPENMVIYVNGLQGSIGYNGSFLYSGTNLPMTLMTQPCAILSFTNTAIPSGVSVKWHPF
jgi:hypothetical protein